MGIDSNKDGIGSKVLLYIGGYKMERLIRTGSSYLSQSEMTATFGLGEHQKIDSLFVCWPSGNKEIFYDIEINNEILIKENSGEIEYFIRNWLNDNKKTYYNNQYLYYSIKVHE